MRARRRILGVVVEIVVRVALVVAVVHAFPKVYTNDVSHFWDVWHGLGANNLPYRDFLWEFPPLTVIPVAAAALFSSETAFAVFLGLVMAGFELASLETLRRCRPSQASEVTLYWMWAALPIALLAWFRLDFMPVLLTSLALLRTQRGRSASAFTVLGIFAKLWPVVLVAASAWRGRWREVAVTAAASALVLIAWYAFSASGFRAFLDYRRGTGFQVESLIGSLLLLAGSRPVVYRSGTFVVAAGRYGWVDPVLFALWACAGLVVVVVATRKKPAHDAAVIGALTIGLILASRLFSPQYLVWVLPFAVLARADGERLATNVFVATGLLTTVYLLGYTQMLEGNRLLDVVVVVRNVALAVTGVQLLRWGWTAAPAHAGARGRPVMRRM